MNLIYRLARPFVTTAKKGIIRAFYPSSDDVPLREDAWVEGLNIGTLIDIGAHKGEFFESWIQLFPKADVFAFEPLKEFAEKLMTDHRENPKVRVFPIALGAENLQNQILNVSSYAPSSSLLPMGELHKSAFPHTAGSLSQVVEIGRLDDVMKGVPLKDDILIKIDTQGYEDRVLDGGEETIARARIVLMEVTFRSLYDGQKLFHDIYMKMHRLGFRFSGVRNQIKSPVDKSILQAHAWFEKNF